jgi:hypothetical protein
MNLKYQLKKRWLGFWQKYKLEVQFKIAFKLFLIFLVVWLIGSMLTVLSQWVFIDKLAGGTPFQLKYINYFWTVIIELVSGFDVQEDLHVVSKIISVIILITGIVIIAIFTGQVVSMFVHVLQRAHHLPEKPGHFKFDRPVIICGINKKLDKIIEELRRGHLSENREIIVVDNDADKIRVTDKKKYKDVWYVKGNQADRNIIENVIGKNESAAIILSKEIECNGYWKYSDSRAIETALAIEGYQEKTHTVVELNNEKNIPHLKHTKINEWISILDYGIKLVSQAALQNGIAKVYSYLLGGDSTEEKTNRIYFTQTCLPERMKELTYEDIRKKVLINPDIGITLIGFAKYVDKETNNRLKLNLGSSFYIRQLNPISRKCITCGCETSKVDELGRVKRKCDDCFQKEKNKNRDAANPLYFPKDTIIKRADQLIYLSLEEVDLKRFFDNLIN